MATVLKFNSLGVATVGGFPGSMLARGDGARRRLVLQAGGFAPIIVYPVSGNVPPSFSGIPIIGWGAYLEFTFAEDPELVVAEWWAWSGGYMSPLPNTIEEYLV